MSAIPWLYLHLFQLNAYKIVASVGTSGAVANNNDVINSLTYSQIMQMFYAHNFR